VTEPDETAGSPTAIEAESSTSEAKSSGVLGFTVPKLSIPTIMLGRAKSQDAAPVEAPDEPALAAEPSEAEAESESEVELGAEPEPDPEPETEAEPEPEPEPEPVKVPRLVPSQRPLKAGVAGSFTIR